MSGLEDAVRALTEVTAENLRLQREHTLAERRRAREDPEFLAYLGARRQPPRKMAFDATTIKALIAPFEVEIPGSYWSQADIDHAEVACPCKEAPLVKVGVPLVCECGRAYLYTGESVFVAFSPAATLPVPEEPPEPMV